MVFGAFGGRIDQTIANINTLFLALKVTDLPVYLVGDGSLACLLLPVSGVYFPCSSNISSNIPPDKQDKGCNCV